MLPEKREASALPALQMDEAELMSVLRNSLYPGARDESIKLVLGYCRAAALDPMQKPVHIVPMSVSTGKKDNDGWDIKEMRDVVMPGIGLYRTQAARSGEYAGVTEPDFGEDVTEKLGDATVTYPKWCRVTVKRLLNGTVVEFTAKEYWRENYATKSARSVEPNAMWKRRPYGQLAKCAEAQALRKAFPEFGAQPTADEMEGAIGLEQSTFENGAATNGVAMPKSRTGGQQNADNQVTDVHAKSDAEAAPGKGGSSPKRSTAASSGELASEGERAWVRRKLEDLGLELQAACDEVGISNFDALTADGFIAMKDLVNRLERK
ncbi:phage recombination protein Bet [Ralstonia holmesii]|uniref:phage recombination protein Bet n=1 Tax=Ralstonia holmesii TaxID=3058602 RepID=UPI0028F538D2|nr:phage recombination protein Bet [Ralstonia sp. LMG 32967]CAJ0698641.1 hypothetical protein R11007_02849 [Ralstonia sp. LMG 32967]